LPYVTKAAQHAGIQMELTGARGRMRPSQEDDTVQLILKTTISPTKNEPSSVSSNSSFVPKSIPLDETAQLLEDVKFSDKIESEEYTQSVASLNATHQLILLSKCSNVYKHNPVHNLTIEEVMPYVRIVIGAHRNWMIHSMALYLKSNLEFDKNKMRERAVFQVQIHQNLSHFILTSYYSASSSC
jgi:hypothetical protein